MQCKNDFPNFDDSFKFPHDTIYENNIAESKKDATTQERELETKKINDIQNPKLNLKKGVF